MRNARRLNKAKEAADTCKKIHRTLCGDYPSHSPHLAGAPSWTYPHEIRVAFASPFAYGFAITVLLGFMTDFLRASLTRIIMLPEQAIVKVELKHGGKFADLTMLIIDGE